MSDAVSATQPEPGRARTGLALFDRPWFRAILIAVTALVLLVPLGLIAGITGERDPRRAAAVEGIHQG